MNHHAPIEINAREKDGVHFLELHGRLTIGESADQLTDALQSALSNGARKVIVNLDGVPQIDSSGISSLVRTSSRPAAAAGSCPSSADRAAFRAGPPVRPWSE